MLILAPDKGNVLESSQGFPMGSSNGVDEIIVAIEHVLKQAVDDQVDLDSAMALDDCKGMTPEQTRSSRFEQTESMEGLNRAVEVGQEAIDVTSSNHPDRPGRLSNLGIALMMRFKRTGSMEDLNRAVEVK